MQEADKKTVFVRRRLSINALKEQEKDNLRFVKNPKTGKLFFMCGEKKGYVSPNVQRQLDTITIDDIQYGECRLEGSNTWVPCIMMNNTENVVKEF